MDQSEIDCSHRPYPRGKLLWLNEHGFGESESEGAALHRTSRPTLFYLGLCGSSTLFEEFQMRLVQSWFKPRRSSPSLFSLMKRGNTDSPFTSRSISFKSPRNSFAGTFRYDQQLNSALDLVIVCCHPSPTRSKASSGLFLTQNAMARH